MGVPNMFSDRKRSSGSFPSPWYDMATANMPKTQRNALEWAEYIWQSHATYRMAYERIVSYFLTSVQVRGTNPDKPLGDDEREQWEQVLEGSLSILSVIKEMGINRACYGNAFASLVIPFTRHLACPKCRKAVFVLEEMARLPQFKFKWEPTRYQFIADCPVCRASGRSYYGPWIVQDRPGNVSEGLHVKIWSPHVIDIRHDEYTDDCVYYWRIPESYKAAIRQGDIHKLARIPSAMLKAIKHNLDFRFAPDMLFHMREKAPAGVKTRGWGVSRTLTNFRNIFHSQVLRRSNEAIVMDYLIPFRVITPDVRNSAGGPHSGEYCEPLRMVDLQQFTTAAKRMIRQHRRDPNTWHVLPQPVKYQTLGGEASMLVPRDMLDQANEELLNAIGSPVEFYRGTLQLDAAPVALRLLEATHKGLVEDYNDFLQWVANRAGTLLALPPISAQLSRVTYADDFQQTMAKLQLMSGQMISQTSGFKSMDLDFKEEQRRLSEEAKYVQQMQARSQEEAEQAAFGEQMAKGQMAEGGQPGGGQPQPGQAMAGGAPMAGGSPVEALFANGEPSLDEIAQAAEMLAQQLLQLPETQRLSELRQLAKKNEMLHAAVKSKMEQQRSQARSAGQAMMLGQQGAAPPQ